MKTHLILAILCLSVLAGSVQAQQVEFNYEGLVKVDGLPYTGSGYFKFAIVNDIGDLSLWSNDGTSTTGDEPAAAVVVDVTDGVFNVIIGDPSLPNMAMLDASLFNVAERVKLRVWFCDTGAGTFEQLDPDRKITNPALLGSQSQQEIALYVNAATGDDDYPGLTPLRPKQTIQAAWNALPPMIGNNATIHLADGVYRERVVMTGKSVIGDATISIIGNAGSPDSVRVTGADAVADTSPAREHCFYIYDQNNLFISGILFDYNERAGIYLKEDAKVKITHCIFRHNFWGVYVQDGSVLDAEYVTASDGEPYLSAYTRAFYYNGQARGRLIYCTVSDMKYGIDSKSYSNVLLTACTISNCDKACVAQMLGSLLFPSPTGSSEYIQKNAITVASGQYGVVGYYNSFLAGPEKGNDFSGLGTHVSAQSGTQVWAW